MREGPHRVARTNDERAIRKKADHAQITAQGVALRHQPALLDIEDAKGLPLFQVRQQFTIACRHDMRK